MRSSRQHPKIQNPTSTNRPSGEGAGSGRGNGRRVVRGVTRTPNGGSMSNSTREMLRNGPLTQPPTAVEMTTKVKSKAKRAGFKPRRTNQNVYEGRTSGSMGSHTHTTTDSMSGAALDALMERLYQSAISPSRALPALPGQANDPLSNDPLSPPAPKGAPKTRSARPSSAGRIVIASAGAGAGSGSGGGTTPTSDIETGNPLHGMTVLFGEKPDGTPVAITAVQVNAKSKTMTGLRRIWGENKAETWAIAHDFDQYVFEKGAEHSESKTEASQAFLKNFPGFDQLPAPIQNKINRNEPIERPFVDLRYNSKLIERRYQQKSTKKSATSCTAALGTAMCGNTKRKVLSTGFFSTAILLITGILVWYFVYRCKDSVATRKGASMSNLFHLINDKPPRGLLPDGHFYATQCKEDLTARIDIPEVLTETATIPYGSSAEFSSDILSCQSSVPGTLYLSVGDYSNPEDIILKGKNTTQPYTLSVGTLSETATAGIPYPLNAFSLTTHRGVINTEEPTITIRFPGNPEGHEFDFGTLDTTAAEDGWIQISGAANTTIAALNEQLQVIIDTGLYTDKTVATAGIYFEYDNCRNNDWQGVSITLPFTPQVTPFTYNPALCSDIDIAAGTSFAAMSCFQNAVTLSSHANYTLRQVKPATGVLPSTNSTIISHTHSESQVLSRAEVLGIFNDQTMRFQPHFLGFGETTVRSYGNVQMTMIFNGTQKDLPSISLPGGTITNPTTTPSIFLPSTVAGTSGQTVNPFSQFTYSGNTVERHTVTVSGAAPLTLFRALVGGDYVLESPMNPTAIAAIRNARLFIPGLASGESYNQAPRISVMTQTTGNIQTATTVISACGGNAPISFNGFPMTYASTTQIATPFSNRTLSASSANPHDSENLLAISASTSPGLSLIGPDTTSASFSDFEAQIQTIRVTPTPPLSVGGSIYGTLTVSATFDVTDPCTPLSTTTISTNIVITRVNQPTSLAGFRPLPDTIEIVPNSNPQIVFPAANVIDNDIEEVLTLDMTIDYGCDGADRTDTTRPLNLAFDYPTSHWNVTHTEAGLTTIQAIGTATQLKAAIDTLRATAPNRNEGGFNANPFLTNICALVETCISTLTNCVQSKVARGGDETATPGARRLATVLATESTDKSSVSTANMALDPS